MYTLPTLVGNLFANFWLGIVNFLPQLIAGFLILITGIIVAGLVKKLVIGFFKLIKTESIVKDNSVLPTLDMRVWPELFGELLRWTVLTIFLVAAVETWGIGKVSDLLNQLLLYIPNVFIAVVIGLVGLVVANLIADVVRHGSASVGAKSAGSLEAMARTAILVFTGLLVLHQLGVAADLIRILFTGIVAMLALAGGLAFGLGGQEEATRLLNKLRQKLEK